MKCIALLTLGSRGDVQPFIALGLGLKAAGCSVCLITYAKFSSLVRSYGIDFFPIHNSYEKIVVEMARSPGNPFTAAQRVQERIGSILDKVLVECWIGCRAADAIISSGTAFWGFDIAEKLDIPHVLAGIIPLNPTKEFPHCMVPPINMHGCINRGSGILVSRLLWDGFSSSINRWRKTTLELSPWEKTPFETKQWENQLELLAYSQMIVPQPKDWAPNVHTTGYWFLTEPEGFKPNQRLLEFIKKGPRPIYIGFGSMTIEKPKELAHIFSEALRKTHQRGILSGDIVHSIKREKHVFCVESSPHSWLFPFVSLIVHHAGAGTTGASIKAGRPSVTIPYFNDQPFWADRLYRLGLSPKPLKLKGLTIEKLTKAIDSVTNNSPMRTRAEKLGQKVRKSNGVDYAVSLILDYLGKV